jgi:ABC-type Zn uptake system ZnuABC Zn-binding protein ZnuA
MAAESFLADMVRNVAGPSVPVATLVPADSDPHEFQPRPSDLARIRSASVLFVSGRGYEAWLAPALPALTGTKIVETSAALPAGSPGADDPHVWMDPRNVPAMVEAVRATLAGLWPGSAAVFSANAEGYAKQVLALDARVRSRFASLPADRRILLTNHDALGRFAAAYGLRILGTVLPGTSTEAAPSARSLGALVETMRSSGARALFLDVGEKSELARQVAKEGGLRVVTDLYVEGLSGPDGPAPSYLAMIEHDAEVIYDGLR